jgi:hypothetical protein
MGIEVALATVLAAEHTLDEWQLCKPMQAEHAEHLIIFTPPKALSGVILVIRCCLLEHGSSTRVDSWSPCPQLACDRQVAQSEVGSAFLTHDPLCHNPCS